MKRVGIGAGWIRAGLLGFAAFAVLLASVGCSTAKYEQQIEEQKSTIAQLENERYQLQTQLSAEKSANMELQRRLMGAKTETAVGAKTARRGNALELVAGKDFKGLEVVDVDGYPAIVLSAGLLFDTGKASVSKTGQTKLAEVAQILKANFSGSTVRVDGHTDNTPIKKSKYASNWALSAARAEAVLNYLVNTAKFDKDRVFLAGFGDTRPRSSNSTESGRKANRRVELVIID